MYKLSGLLFTKLKYLVHKISGSNRYRLTKRIARFIESENCDLPAEEKKTIMVFLGKILVSQISYLFIKEYHYRFVRVYWDKSKSLHYVLHYAKSLYFPKEMSIAKIRQLYNTLCLEQDIRSPHAYFAFPVPYQLTDVVADIGAAEGIWALDIVEKVKTVYLFECEDSWIEALQATFEPWKDKVFIVNKYVSDFTNENHTTLDDYFYPKNVFPTIIKADIEGAEVAAMKGASKLLTHHIQHALLCTYHSVSDFSILSELMQTHHFEVGASKGYMITIYAEPDYSCNDIAAIIRKGLIHAEKK